LVDENNEPLPISVSDIREVVKAEKFNLLLAQVFTLSMHPDDKITELRGILPSSGITAGFGVMFTGIDQMDSGNSLFAVSSGSIFKDRIADLFQLLKNTF